MPPDGDLAGRLSGAVVAAQPRVLRGRIERISGTMIEARLAGVRVGELCRLHDPGGTQIEAEVVGIADGRAYLTPIGTVAGLSSLAEVVPTHRKLDVAVGHSLLGRVLDGLGRPLDWPDDPPPDTVRIAIDGSPPPPLSRPPVCRPLPLGTRAIDALMTCGLGQRIGVFGPAGTGKSSLIARASAGARWWSSWSTRWGRRRGRAR